MPSAGSFGSSGVGGSGSNGAVVGSIRGSTGGVSLGVSPGVSPGVSTGVDPSGPLDVGGALVALVAASGGCAAVTGGSAGGSGRAISMELPCTSAVSVGGVAGVGDAISGVGCVTRFVGVDVTLPAAAAGSGSALGFGEVATVGAGSEGATVETALPREPAASSSRYAACSTSASSARCCSYSA